MYSNGSFNHTPGNGPPIQMHLSHLQQSHTSHAAPTPVQQAYMYPPPPPPPATSAPQAQLITVPGTTQSYTTLSYIYPSSQGETQTLPGSSQQFHFHLPPVSRLPPPPPLPPGTMPPSQASPNPFHPLQSFPHSVPSRSLEPPRIRLPPPPPRSSLALVADTACDKPEATKHVCENVSLNGVEGPVVEENSIHCEESHSPLEKEEHDAPLCTDPDIEMEDDITLPENENNNYTSQRLNCGSDQVPGAYLSTEQPPPQRISAVTNSIPSITMNFQTELPGSKSYVQIHQGTDDCSRQASSSPYSGRAKIVPECGLGDMYDPFVDSFEPASAKLDCVQEYEQPGNDLYTVPKTSISSNRPLNMEENNQCVDKQALSESDMTARASVSSNKPPYVEENTIEAMVSEDNYELNENAENEREGNSHETGTPNSHNENLKASINVQEPKEKESSSSSRYMKHFKVALTKFVKDLLKPSWRQGNMSKEAFKTIVKRAVEKVSKSMEGRRIPKSKAKIDKYIDTQQHKLTKLVMGYVDKYVKA